MGEVDQLVLAHPAGRDDDRLSQRPPGRRTGQRAERDVVGVTTNPTIFATALSDGSAYNEQVAELAAAGQGVDEAVFAITTKDVMAACDILRPVYDATNGEDGRVSIEVDPRYAADEAKTIAQARELWQLVDRENLMIKIPATVEGLPAISATLAEGISVNVTLIFSLERYRAVINAYLLGLEQALEALGVPFLRAKVGDRYVHERLHERGLTLVLVSHDLAVVRHLCQEVAVIQDGRIVESGNLAQVYAEPRHDLTRRLLAAVPTIRGLDEDRTWGRAAAPHPRRSPSPPQHLSSSARAWRSPAEELPLHHHHAVVLLLELSS